MVNSRRKVFDLYNLAALAIGKSRRGAPLACVLIAGALLLSSRPGVADDAATKANEKPATRTYIANIDGSEMKRLTELEEYQFQGSPEWSQDGTLIAFDAWKPQKGEDLHDSQIVVVNADGSNPRVLCDGAMPSFSPRAKRIVFSRYSPNRGVWVMSSEGPEHGLALLDESGWSGVWSPDGTKIAYTKYDGSGANIVIFDLIEGDRRLLFEAGDPRYSTIYWNFTWSPDGKQIVFKGGKGDQYEVAIVDTRGAEHGLVTRYEGQTSGCFAWSPDGKRILFCMGHPEHKLVQLFSVDSDTSAPPQWLPWQDPKVRHTNATYSPDGKRLAISRQPAESP